MVLSKKSNSKVSGRQIIIITKPTRDISERERASEREAFHSYKTHKQKFLWLKKNDDETPTETFVPIRIQWFQEPNEKKRDNVASIIVFSGRSFSLF